MKSSYNLYYSSKNRYERKKVKLKMDNLVGWQHLIVYFYQVIFIEIFVHMLVHLIVGKVTYACGMFTYWLVIGQISEVDNKICSNLCDPKLGGELVVNLCFTHFYFLIDSLSIFIKSNKQLVCMKHDIFQIIHHYGDILHYL
jgi:hypothetical protein